MLDQDLGKVTVGDKIHIRWQLPENYEKVVKTVTASCGCTGAKYNKNTRYIDAEYVPKGIPMHMKAQGWYITTKSVTIHHTDGTNKVLKFTAEVHAKK